LELGFEVIDRVTVTVTWAELWPNSVVLAEQSTVKSRVQSTNSRPFDENCKFTNFTLITKHESRTAWSCRGPILIPILWPPGPLPLHGIPPYSISPALGHSLLLHNHHHLHRLGLLPPRCGCRFLRLSLFLVTWVLGVEISRQSVGKLFNFCCFMKFNNLYCRLIGFN